MLTHIWRTAITARAASGASVAFGSTPIGFSGTAGIGKIRLTKNGFAA
jgi:hypothetical protein